MDNGKYFAGFSIKDVYKVDYLSKYKPDLVGSNAAYPNWKLYHAENIAELDRSIKGYEYDPETKTVNEYDVTVNWPHEPLWVMDGNRVYPLCQVFALHAGYGVIKMGDTLYYALYFYSFDPQTGEVAQYSTTNSVIIFSSKDNGRTWNYHSQVSPTGDAYSTDPDYNGFCEPMMEIMPDGSVVMLIRTGSGRPSYITRSTDQCKTWSEPKVFDSVGVLPQILTLDCGVTLATYGRPGIFVRATGDPSGLNWEKPISVLLQGGSCCYTSMLPLDDHTALMVYSDQGYPNANGEPVRTVLVRTISVIIEN
jgi:hypothetical protein